MKTALRLTIAGALLAPARFAAAPVPVSPGEASGLVTVPSACPTFSWVGPADARGYELVVLPTDAQGSRATAEPALRQVLPAGAGSWTPPLERCLAAGERYAWLVRAQIRGGTTAWSEPRLFQVAAGPSEADLMGALEVVRRYLGTARVGEQRFGTNNVAIGRLAGLATTTSSNNIHIGHVGVAADGNKIRIGTPGTQTETLIAGIFDNTSNLGSAVLVNLNGDLGTTTSSRRFKEDIRDLGVRSARLGKLRPVSFRYKK